MISPSSDLQRWRFHWCVALLSACSAPSQKPPEPVPPDESIQLARPEVCSHAGSYPFPAAAAPDEVKASRIAARYTLENNTLVTRYVASETLRRAGVENRLGGAPLGEGDPLFSILLRDGTRIDSTALTLDGTPILEAVDGQCDASVEDLRYHGMRLSAVLSNRQKGLKAEWSAELRNGSNFVRERVRLTTMGVTVPVASLLLPVVHATAASRVGDVQGSVVIADGLFLGAENPLANTGVGSVPVHIGEWKSGEIGSAMVEVRYDVTRLVDEAGKYDIHFQYTSGGLRLEIHRVELLADGAVVATDSHFGATGAVDTANTYVLTLPTRSATAKYEVVAKVRTDIPGLTDSNGVVSLAKVPAKPLAFSQLERNADLLAGDAMVETAVMGALAPGQQRRSFMHYLERSRARPYRTFLHYNSWYDIGYGNRYSAADAVRVVEAYGTELAQKRGVTIDSFLMDDGWDDSTTVWNFTSGFPMGMAPVTTAAQKYGAAPGMWLSPFGGYGDQRDQRLAAGMAQGFETNSTGFALSGPKYFEHFKRLTLEMIQKYQVNQFKFDGIGRESTRYPGSQFSNDFEAAIALIRALREAKPDLYVNLTTGTWPSPFWLRHSDSIWRGGYDHDFLGGGTLRQQWMTYRDADTYEGVVSAGPLYPLSSLMVHGVIFARQVEDLDSDPGRDLPSEMKTAFGMGTQLQELYVSPEKLDAAGWDTLAECAKWSRAHAAQLRDVHWVGGDPAKAVPYGWASWLHGKGTLTLRNPSATAQTYSADAAAVFELLAPQNLTLTGPFAQRVMGFTVPAGGRLSIELQPWEVLVFDVQ